MSDHNDGKSTNKTNGSYGGFVPAHRPGPGPLGFAGRKDVLAKKESAPASQAAPEQPIGDSTLQLEKH